MGALIKTPFFCNANYANINCMFFLKLSNITFGFSCLPQGQLSVILLTPPVGRCVCVGWVSLQPIVLAEMVAKGG